MRHPFMSAMADDLATLGIATLRYQFPYMEKSSRRPDPPALCHATVRAAVAAAGLLEPALPLIAGGKSFGGRMTSQAQAAAPLQGVRGLAFLGFPLHPPKQPSDARGEHLMKVRIPMLFLQGTRDAFAELPLLEAARRTIGDARAFGPAGRCGPLFSCARAQRKNRPRGKGRTTADSRRVDEIDHPMKGPPPSCKSGPAAERDDGRPQQQRNAAGDLRRQRGLSGGAPLLSRSIGKQVKHQHVDARQTQ